MPKTGFDFGNVAAPEYPEIASDLDSLTSVPSLGANPEKDPIFQEMQKIFGAQSPPPLSREHSQEFYRSIDSRLTAAAQLSSAARRIAQEASRLDRGGNRQEAERLLVMLTKIREIAAELLVSVH